MKIGELAAQSGVSAKTIRFWEEAGVLPLPPRSPSGYRDYQPAIADRLTFIRHAQSAGLSLDQIRRVLGIGDSGERPCQHVTQLINERLAEVEARIADLKATRSHLRLLARRAADQDPTQCSGYCSILDDPAAERAGPVATGLRALM
jgi:MerR family copper efflux transcriptional regulator